MKALSCLAVLSTLLLLFPLSILAKQKNQHSLALSDSVLVGTTQLQPGTYTVEWQEAGPAVTIEFLQGSKVVATVPGTLKTNDQQITQDDIVIQTRSDNRKVLTEIDFARQKETLVLSQQGV
ncbi:MAG TPA: hypothetical protein VMH03_10615 [Terriglobales bacterium]|nr:hypothetical protein [Terriglobales bacterium]